MVVYPYFRHYSRCISHLIGVNSPCAFSLHQWLRMLNIFSWSYLPSLILHWWSVPFQLFMQFCSWAVWFLLVESLSISIYLSIYPGYKSYFRHNLQMFSQVCGLIFNSLNNVFTGQKFFLLIKSKILCLTQDPKFLQCFIWYDLWF